MMILNDYKGLNSKNLVHLTLTLWHAKVIKGQDIKKTFPLAINFHLMYSTIEYTFCRFEQAPMRGGGNDTLKKMKFHTH